MTLQLWVAISLACTPLERKITVIDLIFTNSLNHSFHSYIILLAIIVPCEILCFHTFYKEQSKIQVTTMFSS